MVECPECQCDCDIKIYYFWIIWFYCHWRSATLRKFVKPLRKQELSTSFFHLNFFASFKWIKIFLLHKIAQFYLINNKTLWLLFIQAYHVSSIQAAHHSITSISQDRHESVSSHKNRYQAQVFYHHVIKLVQLLGHRHSLLNKLGKH